MPHNYHVKKLVYLEGSGKGRFGEIQYFEKSLIDSQT